MVSGFSACRAAFPWPNQVPAAMLNSVPSKAQVSLLLSEWAGLPVLSEGIQSCRQRQGASSRSNSFSCDSEAAL